MNTMWANLAKNALKATAATGASGGGARLSSPWRRRHLSSFRRRRSPQFLKRVAIDRLAPVDEIVIKDAISSGDEVPARHHDLAPGQGPADQMPRCHAHAMVVRMAAGSTIGLSKQEIFAIKYAAENGCGCAECAGVKEYVRGPPPKLQSKKKEGKNKAATCATATGDAATGDATTDDAATGAASP